MKKVSFKILFIVLTVVLIGAASLVIALTSRMAEATASKDIKTAASEATPAASTLSADPNATPAATPISAELLSNLVYWKEIRRSSIIPSPDGTVVTTAKTWVNLMPENYLELKGRALTRTNELAKELFGCDITDKEVDFDYFTDTSKKRADFVKVATKDEAIVCVLAADTLDLIDIDYYFTPAKGPCKNADSLPYVEGAMDLAMTDADTESDLQIADKVAALFGTSVSNIKYAGGIGSYYGGFAIKTFDLTLENGKLVKFADMNDELYAVAVYPTETCMAEWVYFVADLRYGAEPETSPTATPEPSAESGKEMTEETISRLFQLKKSDIIAKFGDDYTLIEPQGSWMKGSGFERLIEYKDLGVIFRFENNATTYGSADDLFCIRTRPDFSFKGTKNGMSFSDIMDKLGPANVEKSWIGMPHNVVYDIIYDFGGFSARYESKSRSGDNCVITFWRNTDGGEKSADNITLPDNFKKEDVVLKSGLTIGDLIIFGCFDRLDLLKHTGVNYIITGTGPEEAHTGYYYKNDGFTLAFEEPYPNEDMKDYFLSWVEIDYLDREELCLKGMNSEMDYSELQSHLGPGKLTKEAYTSDGGDSGFEYTLSYDIGNFALTFTSIHESGEKWVCRIWYTTSH